MFNLPLFTRRVVLTSTIAFTATAAASIIGRKSKHNSFRGSLLDDLDLDEEYDNRSNRSNWNKAGKGKKGKGKNKNRGRVGRMGQEASSPIDENTPPETLEARTLEAVAKYILAGKARKICVMTGAGISTSAGIPDFRSPDTGLYANLERLNLPYAEAVFSIDFFRQNPEPFYTLAQELYPGNYRPTITHSFVKLLYDKGLLLKLFTQNIDCLEREAGVPDDKIVEAHGSFARQSCIDCKAQYPDENMRLAIGAKQVPRCFQCNGLVKPEIVFFGEQLPESFFENRMLPSTADLVIVLGTSLQVQPFASLPNFASMGVPRLLINLEEVGSFGTRADDVMILGDCDEGVRKLAKALGWDAELEEAWKQTEKPGQVQPRLSGQEKIDKEREAEDAEDEVDELTKEIEKTLNLSKSHQERLKREFGFSLEEGSKTSSIAADQGSNSSDRTQTMEGNSTPVTSAEHQAAKGDLAPSESAAAKKDDFFIRAEQEGAEQSASDYAKPTREEEVSAGEREPEVQKPPAGAPAEGDAKTGESKDFWSVVGEGGGSSGSNGGEGLGHVYPHVGSSEDRKDKPSL